MNQTLTNKKGLTLIELIVTISLMGIVVVPMFSFFYMNLRSYRMADDQIEAQYQAQVAINELVENIMAAEKIEQVFQNNININITDRDWYDNITRIRFRMTSSSFFIVEYNSTTRQISIATDSAVTNQLAVNVDQFEIRLLDESTDPTGPISIPDASGIGLRIRSRVNNEVVEVENSVYFRNN